MIRCSHLVLILPLLLALSPQGVTQAKDKFIPAPLRMDIPFEAAWDAMLEILEQNGFEILSQDRGQGHILSSFHEYSSGPLTESHISKIGENPELVDGEWIRVRYQYEIFVELITHRETLLRVYANIEALKREFLGREDWIKIETIGKLEEQLLTQFGKSLFGEIFSLPEPKKGFLDQEPVYLPSPEERTPRIIGPERP